MTQADAEKRLGFRLREINIVPVQRMLEETKYEGLGLGSVSNTKEGVFKEIVKYIDIEDFPIPADGNLKESNISDLVYGIISIILFDVKRETGAQMDETTKRESGYCRRLRERRYRGIYHDGLHFCGGRKFRPCRGGKKVIC